jgi:hypothetical protein
MLPRPQAPAGELQGWQFRIAVIPTELRITASTPGGDPPVWVVTTAGKVTGTG